jgi:hypothetical protein
MEILSCTDSCLNSPFEDAIIPPKDSDSNAVKERKSRFHANVGG